MNSSICPLLLRNSFEKPSMHVKSGKRPISPTEDSDPQTTQPTSTPDGPNTVICYKYAAWRSDRKAAGLAWIFTDHTSKEITRCSQLDLHLWLKLLQTDALFSMLRHFSQIWLRSDSQGLVTAINSNRRSIELFGILSDVASLISSKFSSILVSFISRLFNGPADT